MLYYLFEYLDKVWEFPGAGMFQYISFRSAFTVITSLVISMVFGKRIIKFLQKQQIGEEIRDLGLEGQMSKKGTPTMGGIIILGSIIIPTLLFADILNIYVILMIITTLWLGLIGFLDDYIKTFRKNKEGLAGRFKIVGQIGLGLIVGLISMSQLQMSALSSSLLIYPLSCWNGSVLPVQLVRLLPNLVIIFAEINDLFIHY